MFKNIYIPIFFGLLLSNTLQAQDASVPLAEGLDEKQALLSALNTERNEEQDILDSRIKQIDMRVSELDSQIKQTSSTSGKLQKVVERVQVLEEKQETIERKSLNTYRYNYSAAVVNLASLEREIKPLLLFNASKNFFATLEKTSNPNSYPGYSKWFNSFKAYVRQNNKKEATLSILNHIINTTSLISEKTPLAGPMASGIFTGISQFITSLGKRQKDLKDESIKMFKLAAVLSQFTHEKNLIETEWNSITKNLEELQSLQQTAFTENFKDILGITRNEFIINFLDENDAIKRFNYIKEITELIEAKIDFQKAKDPETWKEDFYKQMVTVQSIKIRFGTLTFRIQENIEKYQILIDMYKDDPIIGQRIRDLESKLNSLKNTFESTFSPQEYIKSSTNMYVVE